MFVKGQSVPHLGVSDEAHQDYDGEELLQLIKVVISLGPSSDTRVRTQLMVGDELFSIEVSLSDYVLKHVICYEQREIL